MDASNQVAITSVGVGITAQCKAGLGTFVSGAGYGADTVIPANNKVTITDSYAFLYEKIVGHFSGDTFSGTIFSRVPSLYAKVSGGQAKSVTTCVSATQSFTATLGATAAVQAKSAKVQFYSMHK